MSRQFWYDLGITLLIFAGMAASHTLIGIFG